MGYKVFKHAKGNYHAIVRDNGIVLLHGVNQEFIEMMQPQLVEKLVPSVVDNIDDGNVWKPMLFKACNPPPAPQPMLLANPQEELIVAYRVHGAVYAKIENKNRGYRITCPAYVSDAEALRRLKMLIIDRQAVVHVWNDLLDLVNDWKLHGWEVKKFHKKAIRAA